MSKKDDDWTPTNDEVLLRAERMLQAKERELGAWQRQWNETHEDFLKAVDLADGFRSLVLKANPRAGRQEAKDSLLSEHDHRFLKQLGVRWD